jgi:AcrR family transcriptional regulator
VKSDKARSTGRRTREARQVQLIETATQLFYEKGYEAASLQDIADRMGVLKGSLYYYFPSKEELLFNVLLTVYQEGLAVLSARTAVSGDALMRLARAVEGHVEHNCRNMEKTTVFFHEFGSLSRGRRRAIIGDDHAYHSIFRELIVQGKKENLIRRDLNTDLAVLSILGSANWVYRWYRFGDSQTPRVVARQLAEMAVSSVATPAAWDDYQAAKSVKAPGRRAS